MSEQIQKTGGSATPTPSSHEGTAAEQVSTSEKKNTAGSPFVRCGKAELSHAALRIVYQSFNEEHVVYIGMADLDQLIRSRFAPAAPVKECRKEQDGTDTAVKIGYACRTSSGKAFRLREIAATLAERAAA